jgi:adenosylmethionine-8-amino-7-oxononanoate aminotransferase
LFEREDRLHAANNIAAALARGLGPCLGMKGVKDVRVRGAVGVVELDAIANLDQLKARLVARGVWVRPFRNIVYLTPALTIDETDLAALTGAIVAVVGEGAG